MEILEANANDEGWIAIGESEHEFLFKQFEALVLKDRSGDVTVIGMTLV